MKNKPIIIVNGEPNSIFLEIFFKALKFKKYNSPILLISSLNLLKFYMKKFKFYNKIEIIDKENINLSKLNNKSINLIDIKYDLQKNIKKISVRSNKFIKNSFDVAMSMIYSGISNKLINGPISKKTFLKKKYLGITEYIAEKSNNKNVTMLIYNKDLSVCPLTTHVPIKQVSKLITKKKISNSVSLINNFYKKQRGFKPKIAILGLNPHCESVDKYNEDEKILKPTIKHLHSLGYKISGPYSADTFFMKKNRNKFDVVIGMYHDQVLTPLKTIFEYDAINITLGLPFLRVTPDHGPNVQMIGKNISNPLSLIKAITFLDKN